MNRRITEYPPIYITKHINRYRGIVPHMDRYKESLGPILYVYRDGMSPYYICTGKAHIMCTGINSVLVVWSEESANSKCVLLTLDGKYYELNPIYRSERHDVVKESIIRNGFKCAGNDARHVTSVDTTMLIESNGVHGACQVSVNDLPKHWYRGYTVQDMYRGGYAVEDMYKRFILGFVDGVPVCTFGNVAEYMIPNGAVKRIVFNGGYVYVKNGYLLHQRYVDIFGNSITSAYNISGRRVGLSSVHGRAGTYHSLPHVVSYDVLKLIVDIGKRKRL